jgi:hypothetical protein
MNFASATAYQPDHKQEDNCGKEDKHPLPSAFHEPMCRILVHVEPAIARLDEHTSRNHSVKDPRIAAVDFYERLG